MNPLPFDKEVVRDDTIKMDGPPTHDGGEDGLSNDHGRAESWWSTRRELRSFAELFGATSLAITQVVLGIFGADASTFVAVRAGTADILAFLAIVVLAPPIVLWVFERLVGFVSDRLRAWVHYGSMALLIVIFVSRLFRPPLGALEVVVILAIAAAATTLVVRVEPVRQFLRYLALSPVLFLVIFVGFTPAGSLLFSTAPPSVESVDAERTPPIILVVLDELPLGSILDGHGEIDAEAFPALAELASDSTFARNNTTVATLTPNAVPAILTGIVPTSAKTLPNLAQHPRNIFTLLDGTYALNASEYVTDLCAGVASCNVPKGTRPSGFRPTVKLLQQVRRVFTESGILFNIDATQADPQAAVQWLLEQEAYRDGKPTLRYLHLNLPHQPWFDLPDGRTYQAPGTEERGSDARSDVAPAQIVRQRHLLQAAYADHLVGELIQGLKDAGTYDESLIIVTSDHGVSYRPDEPLRLITAGNVDDIAWTLCLIKEPDQHDTRLIDSPTSSVDILPTVVDLLGIDTGWDMDGLSMMGEPRPSDWTPRLMPWKEDILEPAADGLVPIDGPSGYADVVARRGLDAEPGEDLRFWRWGDYGDLVGREVRPGDTETTRGTTFTLDDPTRFRDVATSTDPLPLYVSGQLDGVTPGLLAVAVNGVVGGWYDTSAGPGEPASKPFRVLIPPSLLRDGDNDITVFVIESDSPDARLTQIPMKD